MPELPHAFKTAFITSAYTLVLENKKTDRHYQQLEKEYSKLFHSIEGLLDKKPRTQMLRLEELQNEMQCTENDLIYLQGMIDCAALLQTIKLL